MSHTKTKAALDCIGRLPFTAFTVAEDTIRLAIFTVELNRKPNTTFFFFNCPRTMRTGNQRDNLCLRVQADGHGLKHRILVPVKITDYNSQTAGW